MEDKKAETAAEVEVRKKLEDACTYKTTDGKCAGSKLIQTIRNKHIGAKWNENEHVEMQDPLSALVLNTLLPLS